MLYNRPIEGDGAVILAETTEQATEKRQKRPPMMQRVLA
jgi:hypothetical protein